MGYILYLIALIVFSCSNPMGKATYRIGIDPTWYSANFGEKEYYVTGFIEDLLQEVSRLSNVSFEKIPTNRENLLPNLRQRKVDGILYTLDPYNFNQEKYLFSDILLAIGPVLVVSAEEKVKTLQDLQSKIVGIASGSSYVSILEKYPTIVIATFDSYPFLLQALATSAINGALLEAVPAIGYLQETFYKQLKIIGEPLNNHAIRLITGKDLPSPLLHDFDAALKKLKKNMGYQKLLEKWQLSLP